MFTLRLWLEYGTRPRLAGMHERTVSYRTVPAKMRRNNLQVVWWRRRAQAPAPDHTTAVPYSRFSADIDPRTGHRISIRLTRSSLHSSGVTCTRVRSPITERSREAHPWVARPPHPASAVEEQHGGRPRTGAPARHHPLRRIDVHVVRMVQPRCPPVSATHALAETDMPE